MELQLHQIEPVVHLGDRVLDLEARVHLHEAERSGVRVEQELDRAGVLVAGRRDEADGRGAQRASSAAESAGDGDSSSTFWWRRWMRAVADAERPHRAVAVGDDLHLDVARAVDLSLEEDVASPNARAASARAPLEGGGELRSASTTRMPRPPPPARRLHEQREAERARRAPRASSSVGTGPPLHGTTARPLARRAAWRRSCRRGSRITAGSVR